MKKKIGVIIAVALAAVMILTLATGVAVAKSPKTDFDATGPHYNLNIVGKKADWNDKSGFDNPDRHTIFIPEDTSNFSYQDPTGETVSGSVKLEIAQDKTSEDIYVVDGTAFDGDGTVAIAMPDKKYDVYVCSRGKPGGTTDIEAMVYYDAISGDYLIKVGELTVTRNWKDAYDLFWVCPGEDAISDQIGGSTITTCMWIFDYLEYLQGLEAGDQYMEYYWDITNNNNKLIKLRFYEK